MSRNIYSDNLCFGRVLRTALPLKLSLSPLLFEIYQVVSLIVYFLRATKIIYGVILLVF